MATPRTFGATWTRLGDRLAARRAVWARPATSLALPPEPRSIGSYSRGRHLLAGKFRFAGHLIEQPAQSIWGLTPPSAAFAAELHSFGWLDDLAAVGDAGARACAQGWTSGWITRFGRGRGPGWTPELTGKRLMRWINHAPFLLNEQDERAERTFYRSLAQQTLFLGRRWQASPSGLPRLHALAGLIHAALTLKGMDDHILAAKTALAHECATQIGEDGTLPGRRNPEDLLEALTLLTWTRAVLDDAGLLPAPALIAAIERIAPTLRNLRHADGGLARFHGGGRGLAGRLDGALVASGTKTRPTEGLAMGYARLSAGRTSLVIDAAPPSTGAASTGAHASTLAFELTSGRRPLIVNCGSGASFGADWQQAGRATQSHSTLVIAGESSARINPSDGRLTDGPTDVPVQISRASDGLRFEGGHNGYVSRFSLTHARTVEMTFDGRGVAGEDMLLALTTEDRERFDKAMIAHTMQGVPYHIHFHLHPDVDAQLDLGGTAVSLALRSGEIWLFRTESRAHITLEPSVYLDKSRLKPRAAKQIVLSGRALEYADRIRWSLAKTQDTPISIRDLAQDAPCPPTDE